MLNIDDYFIGLTIGVRFRANFSIEDQLGSMVDEILYAKNSFFNSKVFPQVRSRVGSKILFNEKTQNRMEIDNSNIILDVNFNDGSFKKDDCELLKRMFEEQIVNRIMKNFKIKEIVRIGYVKRFVYEMENLANTFVNKTIGGTLGGINDINLSFSKKFTTPEGLIKKDVHDYDNVIFNIIKKSDLQEIFIAIDYQCYYHPFLNDISELNIKHFYDRAESFSCGKYIDWLNKNYLEVSNA
ncbi:MAG TPA: hypothetical protein PLZ82_08115 [Smithellaceae bacterium]|nr:hypothetical protein [Smithellaceae bacterium]HQH05351.1 hypothetical protein [Smithellaceae bacterium]HQJ78565.1 hypothetical protein [Smithellaceae bacterium]